MLKEKYKDLILEGIEPFNDGFNIFKKINSIVKSYGVNIQNIDYEQFSTNTKYDLIFCVNVFEHLNDWRNFLDKSIELLEEDGQLVILCPNYGFPFESHFLIPIIINKNLTL